MPEKTALYLMNKKGLMVLQALIKTNFKKEIEFICIGQDAKVQKDYSLEIEDLSRDNDLDFYYRNSEPDFNGLKMAIGWRWLLSNLEKLIVFHDSLLPRYRGFAPVTNALVNGEKTIGATCLWAEEEYDKGDVIFQKEINLNYPISIEEVVEQMGLAYSIMAVEVFRHLSERKELPRTAQDEENASYSIWLDDTDYQIDWTKSAAYLKRFIDARSFPYKGASGYMNSELVRLMKAEEITDSNLEIRHPGKVLFIEGGFPIVICGSGLLKILEIKSMDDGRDMLPLKRLRTRFS